MDFLSWGAYSFLGVNQHHDARRVAILYGKKKRVFDTVAKAMILFVGTEFARERIDCIENGTSTFRLVEFALDKIIASVFDYITFDDPITTTCGGKG